MKTYIGTKIIEAVPAIRKGCKVYEKDQPIAMGMVPDEEGYRGHEEGEEVQTGGLERKEPAH